MDKDGHHRLLNLLSTVQGRVIVSGYPSSLYDEKLSGWFRREKHAKADGGVSRREVLWMNFRSLHL